MARYEPKGVEAEFEPGSRGRVLRNLLGITRAGDMNLIEAQALQSAMHGFIGNFDEHHSFTAGDIRDMHRTWLGAIYEWAGEYRSVNIRRRFSVRCSAPRFRVNVGFREERVGASHAMPVFGPAKRCRGAG